MWLVDIAPSYVETFYLDRYTFSMLNTILEFHLKVWDHRGGMLRYIINQTRIMSGFNNIFTDLIGGKLYTIQTRLKVNQSFHLIHLRSD